MGAGDEGAGGIVHQHHLRRVAGERGKAIAHRVRPHRTADHDADPVQALQHLCGAIGLAGGHHHDQQIGARGGQTLDRPSQHRPASHLPPLLGGAGSGPASRSGGDDDG